MEDFDTKFFGKAGFFVSITNVKLVTAVKAKIRVYEIESHGDQPTPARFEVTLQHRNGRMSMPDTSFLKESCIQKLKYLGTDL